LLRDQIDFPPFCVRNPDPGDTPGDTELFTHDTSVPAKSVPEFIAYAKGNPGEINMASPGYGTSQHVSGELFKMMTGVNTLRRRPIGFIRAGQIRPLAVTTASRSVAIPEIPNIAEFVPGYEGSSWYGIGAPKNTSAGTVAILNKDSPPSSPVKAGNGPRW
jgi:tripartite-type tricarboxylate transporter receptor subunit TctC